MHIIPCLLMKKYEEQPPYNPETPQAQVIYTRPCLDTSSPLACHACQSISFSTT